MSHGIVRILVADGSNSVHTIPGMGVLGVICVVAAIACIVVGYITDAVRSKRHRFGTGGGASTIVIPPEDLSPITGLDFSRLQSHDNAAPALAARMGTRGVARFDARSGVGTDGIEISAQLNHPNGVSDEAERALLERVFPVLAPGATSHPQQGPQPWSDASSAAIRANLEEAKRRGMLTRASKVLGIVFGVAAIALAVAGAALMASEAGGENTIWLWFVILVPIGGAAIGLLLPNQKAPSEAAKPIVSTLEGIRAATKLPADALIGQIVGELQRMHGQGARPHPQQIAATAEALMPYAIAFNTHKTYADTIASVRSTLGLDGNAYPWLTVRDRHGAPMPASQQLRTFVDGMSSLSNPN